MNVYSFRIREEKSSSRPCRNMLHVNNWQFIFPEMIQKLSSDQACLDCPDNLHPSFWKVVLLYIH